MAFPEKRIELLLVDDDSELRDDMTRFFTRRGYSVSECPDGESALAFTLQRSFDVIVLDMRMPGMSGLDVLQTLKDRGSAAEVVMLTGQGSIETAVEAMKLGAREFLGKPVGLRDLDVLVRKLVESVRMRREKTEPTPVPKPHKGLANYMVGDSQKMNAVYRLIERTAGATNPILIQGESGTGKELVARALHAASPLSNKPLVVINCAALPETLLESELFGHEKGAFTGAVNAKPGLFEVADGGTLFIDEFGELAGSLQAKLLRVLEDGSMRRVGSVEERHVQVRIIAATNRNMIREVEEGRFREDLYYRINVLTINLPPLRERLGDVPLLMKHFLGPEWSIDDDVMSTLERYNWPGNVRQLANAVERAKILAADHVMRLDSLPPEIVSHARNVAKPPPGSPCDLGTLTKLHIEEIYRKNRGNKARTAKALGIGRRTLYRLIEKFQLEDPKEQNQCR